MPYFFCCRVVKTPYQDDVCEYTPNGAAVKKHRLLLGQLYFLPFEFTENTVSFVPCEVPRDTCA